jgi:KDO2-lipid IV(A) lauroyltransferase
MSAISYYLSLPILYGISLLPFPVLYFLSDMIYLVLYKLIGYRTKVVEANLRNAFPEKNDQEIRQIQDRFYRYFCDLVLETLKTLTINRNTLKKRLTFEDLTVFEDYYRQEEA